MKEFMIRATLTKEYEVPIMAENELDAIKQLDDWIAYDFEDFEVNAQWDFVAR
jgi:hypothetical protein